MGDDAPADELRVVAWMRELETGDLPGDPNGG